MVTASFKYVKICSEILSSILEISQSPYVINHNRSQNDSNQTIKILKPS